MSSPNLHHYVPQVYLKSFVSSEKGMFVLHKKYKAIATKLPVQVCYLKNLYKLQRAESLLLNGVEDPYIIETKVFAHQENRYKALLDTITFPHLQQFGMYRADAKYFIQTLLNIKRRNPSVKNELTARMRAFRKQPGFAQVIERDLHMTSLFSQLQEHNVEPEEFAQKFINSMDKEPDRLDDSYNARFLDKEKNITNRVADTLMDCKIEILYTKADQQFITSDNPGFLVIGSQLSNFAGFGDDFEFYFPLTPVCCLLIRKKNTDEADGINKTIYPVTIDQQSVSRLNQCTLEIANEKVFSFSSALIEKIRNMTA